jgi:hypothetical protein
MAFALGFLPFQRLLYELFVCAGAYAYDVCDGRVGAVHCWMRFEGCFDPLPLLETRTWGCSGM